MAEIHPLSWDLILYSFVTSESQVLSPGDALIVDYGMRIAEFSILRLILRQAQDAAW